MRDGTWLGRLIGCERGNTMLVSAAALPLLISSAALAYDTVQLAVWMQQLQEVADAGAAAGAEAVAEGRPVSEAVDRAVASDRRVDIVAPILIQNGPARGPHARDRQAVRVVLTSQRPLIFLGALMRSPPTRSAEATAIAVRRRA